MINQIYGNGNNQADNSGAEPRASDFNVPDYRGMFLRGVNQGSGRDPDVNARTANKIN